jgi:ubiquinone biosynthesis protein UbiJ
MDLIMVSNDWIENYMTVRKDEIDALHAEIKRLKAEVERLNKRISDVSWQLNPWAAR